MSDDGPRLVRPIPRRPFDISLTIATPPDAPSTPNPELECPNPNLLDSSRAVANGGADTPSVRRTRSVLNLTTSTLFGIYSPTSYGTEREETPGTGAATPRDRESSAASPPLPARRPSRRGSNTTRALPTPLPKAIFNIAVRSVLLFLIGMGYGVLVTHLHNDQQLAPFEVEGLIKPRYDWGYLIFWGVAGVGLGSLLPWVDTLSGDWALETQPGSENEGPSSAEGEDAPSASPADWNRVVRSIGAFVGIAFAIRKLSWASTLQVSLTLALVNPVLWYLVDRSRPGFLLSSSVALCGTAVLVSLNPEMMPSPAASAASSTPHHNSPAVGGPTESSGLILGLVSKETVECGTWIASVLFCSCVCFGNVGRRLALNRPRAGPPYVGLGRDSK